MFLTANVIRFDYDQRKMKINDGVKTYMVIWNIDQNEITAGVQFS